MAKLDAARIRSLFLNNRDRILVVFCLFLALGAFAFYLKKQNEPYEVLISKVKDEMDKRPRQAPKPVSDITENMVKKPPQSEYEAIAKKNIFQKAEVRLKTQKEIQKMYDELQGLRSGGGEYSSASVIKICEKIIELDREQIMVNYPVKPSEIIEDEKKKMITNEIQTAYGEAQGKFAEAEKSEKAGDAPGALALYQESHASYKKILDATAATELSDIRANSTKQVDEVSQRIKRITESTFRQEVQGYYDQAAAFTSKASEDPSNLADARDALKKALARIQEVDPNHQTVTPELVNQITTTQSTVDGQIAQREPALYAQGKKQADEGKSGKNLDLLNKALATYEVILKISPTHPTIQTEIAELKAAIASVSSSDSLTQFQSLLTVVRQALDAVTKAMQAEDFEAFQKAKKEGLENCAAIRGMKGDATLEQQKKQAIQVEEELRKKEFPPAITDWELFQIAENYFGGKAVYKVILHKVGTPLGQTVQISEKETDATSGLTVVEVDKQGKSFAFVRKSGFRKTKIEKKK